MAVLVLMWTDVWCFYCKKHFYRPATEHAYVCKDCERVK